MKTYRSQLILIALTLIPFFLSAQETERESQGKKNRIAPVLGYTFVPEEIADDDKGQFRVIPTFGIDYERKLGNKWALGLFNDIELTSYLISDEAEESGLLERDFVFITTIVVIYSIKEQWTVFGGGGYEFEKNKNFAVMRLGTEYEIPIRNEWDVAFGLNWDYKEVYQSLGFTVAFGKRF